MRTKCLREKKKFYFQACRHNIYCWAQIGLFQWKQNTIPSLVPFQHIRAFNFGSVDVVGLTLQNEGIDIEHLVQQSMVAFSQLSISLCILCLHFYWLLFAMCNLACDSAAIMMGLLLIVCWCKNLFVYRLVLYLNKALLQWSLYQALQMHL